MFQARVSVITAARVAVATALEQRHGRGNEVEVVIGDEYPKDRTLACFQEMVSRTRVARTEENWLPLWECPEEAWPPIRAT